MRRSSYRSLLAPGPHPRRELTLTPRLGFACPRLGVAAGASFSYWRQGPPPARTDADASLAALLGRQRRRAAGAYVSNGAGPHFFQSRRGPTPAAVARRFAPRNGSRLPRELMLTPRPVPIESQIPFDPESRVPNPNQILGRVTPRCAWYLPFLSL